jgi:hypothetical protein
MKSQYCFVHYSCQHGYVLYLLFFRNPAQFILKCNGHFGFQESFLLLDTHITNVPKLTEHVKYWDFDFGTGFGTLIHAQTLGSWQLFRTVPKTIVSDTRVASQASGGRLKGGKFYKGGYPGSGAGCLGGFVPSLPTTVDNFDFCGQPQQSKSPTSMKS